MQCNKESLPQGIVRLFRGIWGLGCARTILNVSTAGANAVNVMPDRVRLGGTLRSLTLKQFDELRSQITHVCPQLLTVIPFKIKEQFQFLKGKIKQSQDWL